MLDDLAVADSLNGDARRVDRFEVDAGLTNRSNYRLEGNAGFGVERLTAAARIV